ncbi:MAG TPA: Hachiman antiphage defense system protein HamA [Allosphingosinicella sp.]|jgi:hypothetical protein
MPLTSLINPETASDAGGVAGRRGQKFQDHVAASLVIDMLADPAIVQIECETADDVTIRWIADGATANEYVQVKTTDGDSKWNARELLARSEGRAGTSIAERSLACDTHLGDPSFRLVTIREPRGTLAHFKIPRADRSGRASSLAAAVASFEKKYPKFKSANGRTLAYWASQLLWQVEPSMEKLADRNRLELLKLAAQHGERPHFSEIEEAYAQLLGIVIDAGDASRVHAPGAKSISRADAQRWWRDQVARFAAETRRTIKVYRVRTEEFFSEFHCASGPSPNRSLSAYDVEYDGGQWRCHELVEHLLDWIPEVVLPPAVLANLDQLSARGLLTRAVEACEAHGGVATKELLAELLLHAILRHHHRSEPIACKIFHMTDGRLTFGSAHVVLDASGDQLWLGQSRLTTAVDRDSMPAAVAAALRAGLDRDVLRRERKIIVQLRHPAHLSEHDLGRSMAANGKIDDLLSVLHVPLLIAYDSEVLAEGFNEEYLDRLRREAGEVYAALEVELGTDFREIRVHIFLIPIECAKTLAGIFEAALRDSS